MIATLLGTGARGSGPETTDEITEEISESATSLIDDIAAALPRVGIAIGIVLVGWVMARAFRFILRRVLLRSNGPSFSTVMSKLASWLLLGLVVGVAVAVTFPSVKPVDLLAGLGFFSVAVGFAFQDILENTLSGVLLLFRQPFVSGDQIEVAGNEGTVEAITIRETRIRRYDGQLLVVPNRDVYKSAIRVQTSRPHRRIDVVIGVGYDEDLDRVAAIVIDALTSLDAVEDDPPPNALVNEFNSSTIDLVARFWVASDQGDALSARDAAIRSMKAALDEAGIDLPFSILTLEAAESFGTALAQPPARGSDLNER